ncbi:hypothetical protein HZQ67_15985 [Elizabethkingia anophelis]|uniref:hypothetical protein n=1 Tax=Elizabethkingia anophelis TaxID=1117645 RepID=UPI0004E41144|nr:hypothetical protein [Elizabethkingia anophelis]KFC38282.1 hypothetical protein FF18_16135 [Elizabethkingia anophelis]MCT3788864.1 hypothetical protein [Elizabethkingia anophelis]MDV3500477.1 hypothetical protein [Elizabethkingia anophelis]
MKKIYWLILPFIFSCSKNIEDRCFVNEKDNRDGDYKEEIPYTVQQILNEKPDYLEIENLKSYRSFKKDSTGLHSEQISINNNEREAYLNQYSLLDKVFSNQFWHYQKQQVGNILYALGHNRQGYWLLKIENDKPSAYFLGLSFSHYYFNRIQKHPIIKGDYLQIEGSLVKIVKVTGLPGYDDYSAIEDGKLFKIKLKDLMQDSDQDGYNDIFEKSFGLNPNNKDTDGDGIDDFNDMNPMYKSEKNKFSQLYEQIIQTNSGILNSTKQNYSFSIYNNDCDYFHQINPNFRVLFIPENKKRRTHYTRITDVTRGGISKIEKDEKNPNLFYITEFGGGADTYSVEYKNGNWKIILIGQIIS